MKTHPCSALREGRCCNGFPVTRGCLPVQFISPRGKTLKWTAPVPICCDEDRQGAMYPDEGKPRVTMPRPHACQDHMIIHDGDMR